MLLTKQLTALGKPRKSALVLIGSLYPFLHLAKNVAGHESDTRASN